MLPKVLLKSLFHRGQQCIGIYFEINSRIAGALRKTKITRFSATHKCWYTSLIQQDLDKVLLALHGKAEVERSALDQYLAVKNINAVTKGPSQLITGGDQFKKAVNKSLINQDRRTEQPSANKSPVTNKARKIEPVNIHVIPAMKQRLKLRAYSASTIKTYINEMTQMLQTLGNIPADNLKAEHLKRYLVYCYEKLLLSENTLHSRINALKFYYEQVLGAEKFFWEIPRPKKQLQLPRFFNQQEITSIIKAAGNVKHKTMLMLAYAAGLRVSEVVNMKVKDIDSQRMCILINQAKGKKDRMVRLSPVLLIMLREYWKTYRPRSQGYLFPGQNPDEAYSSRSLQLVIAAAKKKAGILKPGSMHALRHSFATHLLDKGTDISMIMKLLGHNDIKTTLRYLHVTNRDMLQIISPLDDLQL